MIATHFFGFALIRCSIKSKKLFCLDTEQTFFKFAWCVDSWWEVTTISTTYISTFLLITASRFCSLSTGKWLLCFLTQMVWHGSNSYLLMSWRLSFIRPLDAFEFDCIPNKHPRNGAIDTLSIVHQHIYVRKRIYVLWACIIKIDEIQAHAPLSTHIFSPSWHGLTTLDIVFPLYGRWWVTCGFLPSWQCYFHLPTFSCCVLGGDSERPYQFWTCRKLIMQNSYDLLWFYVLFLSSYSLTKRILFEHSLLLLSLFLLYP